MSKTRTPDDAREAAMERWNRERWERIGDLDPQADTTPARPHLTRTIEDCARENEEFRRLGIEVICRPTWEGIEEARSYVEARRRALAQKMAQR